ncbi:MAG: ABC transporter permease [Gemmatimonadaceae bacterium]
MDLFLQDLRYAVRSLARSRGFTTVAVLVLGLGIAANTAIFSVVNGVLLKPLPYANPDRVVMLWSHWENWPQTWVSPPEFADYTRELRSAEHVAAFDYGSRNLTGGDRPERIRAAFGSGELFPTLGAHAAVGRVFTASDDVPGAARVAVLSDGLWRRRFGGDLSMLGQTIRLSDSTVTVIGIMPAAFELPLDFGQPVDLWMPLALGIPDPGERGNHGLNVVARLRAGTSIESAQRELDGLTTRLRATYPRDYGAQFGASLVPVKTQVVGKIGPALLVLLGAVGFVLLIACANVANLLLARAESREREIAVRTALGAGRGRIVRQLLTESAVLALAGGTLGLLLAVVGLRALIAMAPASVPRIAEVGIDARVLAFTIAVAMTTGILFGLAPALHATRGNLHGSLKSGARGGTAGGPRLRLRRVLAIGEIAVSLVLVIGACLLVQSFARLRNVDPGFDPERVLTMRVSLAPARYPSGREVRAFYRALIDRARSLPGVQSVGAVRVLPMTSVIGDWGFAIEGRQTAAGAPSYSQGDWQVVTPDYFRAMRIPVKRGRSLSDADDDRAPGAIMFNDALAAKVFPGDDAVGHRVRMGGDTVWRTIVGVVGNVRHRGLDEEARPELYLPHAQWPTANGPTQRAMVLTLRTAGEPTMVAGALRREVRALDPDVPVSEMQPMVDVLGSWVGERRLTMLVLGLLAATALVLAAVGTYGVLSYTVAQRTREIGIRIALGARSHDVVTMVVRQGTTLAVAGVLVGTLAALLLTRLLAGLLYGVPARDPLTFAGVAALLLVTAIGATYVPALRATRVEPTEALRAE